MGADNTFYDYLTLDLSPLDELVGSLRSEDGRALERSFRGRLHAIAEHLALPMEFALEEERRWRDSDYILGRIHHITSRLADETDITLRQAVLRAFEETQRGATSSEREEELLEAAQDQLGKRLAQNERLRSGVGVLLGEVNASAGRAVRELMKWGWCWSVNRRPALAAGWARNRIANGRTAPAVPLEDLAAMEYDARGALGELLARGVNWDRLEPARHAWEDLFGPNRRLHEIFAHRALAQVYSAGQGAARDEAVDGRQLTAHFADDLAFAVELIGFLDDFWMGLDRS